MYTRYFTPSPPPHSCLPSSPPRFPILLPSFPAPPPSHLFTSFSSSFLPSFPSFPSSSFPSSLPFPSAYCLSSHFPSPSPPPLHSFFHFLSSFLSFLRLPFLFHLILFPPPSFSPLLLHLFVLLSVSLPKDTEMIK